MTYLQRNGTDTLQIDNALASMLDAEWYAANPSTFSPEHFDGLGKPICTVIVESYKNSKRPPTHNEIVRDLNTLPDANDVPIDVIDKRLDILFNLHNSDALKLWKTEEVYKFAMYCDNRLIAKCLADDIDAGVDPKKTRKLIQDVLNQQAKHKPIGWELKKLRNFDYIYRPEYIAGDLVAKGWLAIFYGSSKCLKSMLVKDMMVGAAGDEKTWLSPLNDDGKLKAFNIAKANTLYIDFDNGDQLLEGRLSAISRGHDCPESVLENMTFDSFPTNPVFSALDEDSINYLIELIKREKYDIVVIDHLLNASGVEDENSSKMAAAIANLRKIAKATNVLIIAIAHTNKSGGSSVRGHGSSTDGADITFFVEREAGTDEITVTCTNSRHYWPKPFRAVFTYTSIPEDNRVLYTARMALIPYEEISESQNRGKAENKKINDLEKAYNWVYENAVKLLLPSQSDAATIIVENCNVSTSYAYKALNKAITDEIFAKGMRVNKTVPLIAGARFPNPEILIKEVITQRRLQKE